MTKESLQELMVELALIIPPAHCSPQSDVYLGLEDAFGDDIYTSAQVRLLRIMVVVTVRSPRRSRQR
jgi:hypothetical protein